MTKINRSLAKHELTCPWTWELAFIQSFLVNKPDFEIEYTLSFFLKTIQEPKNVFRRVFYPGYTIFGIFSEI